MSVHFRQPRGSEPFGRAADTAFRRGGESLVPVDPPFLVPATRLAVVAYGPALPLPGWFADLLDQAAQP
jgi:hypothetical protein